MADIITLNLRLPEDVHAALKAEADRQRWSLNTTITTACEAWLAMTKEHRSTGQLKSTAVSFMSADYSGLQGLATADGNDFKKRLEAGLATARKVRNKG